jgi:hypothetical protein
MQDGIERHVWGKQEFVKDAGSIIKVRGTGTEDQEAPVFNNGTGMHLPENFNTEVILFASGSDPNLKQAMLSIPKDKQRQWKENTNGVQYALDSARALQFDPKRAYLDDANFATRGGVFEVKGDDIYVRGNLYVSGDVGSAGVFKSPNNPHLPDLVGPEGVDVPSFDEYSDE